MTTNQENKEMTKIDFRIVCNKILRNFMAVELPSTFLLFKLT